VVCTVLALVGTVAVVATSPTIQFAEEGVAAPASSPTVIAPTSDPEWIEHGDETVGFTIQAPPDWKELRAGTALLNIGSRDTSGFCTISSDPVPRRVSLEQIVASSVAGIRKAKDIRIDGGVRTEAATLPAGPAELVRFRARVSGLDGTFFQYYLLDSKHGLGHRVPRRGREEHIVAPVFEQMMGSFRFTAEPRPARSTGSSRSSPREVVPQHAGRPLRGAGPHDLVRRDDHVDPEVVVGLGEPAASIWAGARSWPPRSRRRWLRLDQQRELEVGVAAALAHPVPARFTATVPHTTRSTCSTSSSGTGRPAAADPRIDAACRGVTVSRSGSRSRNGRSSSRRGTAM
jgi:hypothetical protein